eukprot:365742-Chlamydomonas_euryale.AAC.9
MHACFMHVSSSICHLSPGPGEVSGDSDPTAMTGEGGAAAVPRRTAAGPQCRGYPDEYGWNGRPGASWHILCTSHLLLRQDACEAVQDAWEAARLRPSQNRRWPQEAVSR